jgi:hypothetical protein
MGSFRIDGQDTLPPVVMVFAGLTQFWPTQKHMPTDLLATLYTRGSIIFYESRPGLGMSCPFGAVESLF